MNKKELIKKICSKKDRKQGKCGCRAEISVGQTDFIPTESTKLVCYKKLA